MALYKFGAAASFITLGITIIYTHAVARLFPAFPAGVSLAVSILIICGLCTKLRFSSNSLAAYILPIVIVAVTSRAYLFLFPASLMGVDPSRYAIEITRIIQVGEINAIGFYFYSRIPLMLLFQAMFGMVTDLSVPDLMILYSLILGVLTPLVVTLLTVWIAPTHPRRMAIAAGCVGMITSLLINFGSEPIAQTLGVIYWMILLVVLARFYRTRSKPDFLFAVLTMSALTFTHKLPLLVVFLVISIFIIMSLMLSGLNLHDNEEYIKLPYGVVLGVLAAVLVVVEWAFLTTFLRSVVLQSIGILLTESIEVSEPFTQIQPTAAVPVDQGITGILTRRGHGLALLAIGGISCLYVGIKQIEEVTANFLLVCVAVPVALLITTVAGNPPGEASPPSIPRLLVFAEPALVPIIIVAIGSFFSRGRGSLRSSSGQILRRSRYISMLTISTVVITVLLVSQLFSPVVVPDYPDNPRRYLTSEEVHAKQFGYDYVDEPIGSDWYLTIAAPPDRETGAETSRYRPLGEPLLNGNMTNMTSQYGQILYRTNVEYYLTSYGPWSLVWEPEKAFDREYNRIYTNRGAILYEREINNESATPTTGF